MPAPAQPVRPSASALYDLSALIAQGDAGDAIFSVAFNALAEAVPYDLATIWRLDGEELRVLAAAGPLDGPKIRRMRLPLRLPPPRALNPAAGCPHLQRL